MSLVHDVAVTEAGPTPWASGRGVIVTTARVGAGGADVPGGDPFSPSAEHCGGGALPGYFATTFAALPLPRNGANIDIITPPPTARQPEQIANAVAETSNCSGEPGTVSP